MTKQEYKDIYNVIGAAMEVHKTLGRGMEEPIYQEALAVEMAKRGMIAEREKNLRLHYKDVLLEKTYFADFYYKGIIIELKSVSEIISDHRAQLFNYMRITGIDRGILFNFGEKFLRSERYLYLPEDDDFELLTQENYMNYITDR
ncbi:MAG: GxxExxY protein [Prevotella sp.]|nr:GxxExxY protein [Prevotella sp.]MBR3479449.1 GxxExxY protein [Prevotella sp.]MBR3479504.1 GxxExxY protein [Prevotella sp.]